MSNRLRITKFGNPVLRQVAKQLTVNQITSTETQMMIAAMHALLRSDDYGVGLAAPQIGKSIALSVIGIKPTPTRPDLEQFDTVIINPSYEGVGRREAMWEGCISCGAGNDTLYARVPRFRKIQATWLDEKGKEHADVLNGFVAHVFQHEVDHLNGVLFVDKVKDTKSYMMADEYRKRIVNKRNR